MGKIKDLTNVKFSRLTALKIDHFGEGNKAYWLCKCDCGKEKVVCGSSLSANAVKSCGCLQKEMIKKANKKHGKSHSRLHYIWMAMKERCYNKNNKDYIRYGGRGIEICDEWRNDFQVFYDWATSNGYEETAEFGKFTIDRIDVNGNYIPSNCKFSTIKEQCNNKTTNHFELYKNKKYTLSQLEDIIGVPQRKIWYYLHKGLSINEIEEKFNKKQ
jgi:hypothetical protein